MIYLYSYNTCCQNGVGGVYIRMKRIKTLLHNRGIAVDLFNPFSTVLQKGDVLHVFMLHNDTCGLIEYAKSKGVKVVISTVVNVNAGRKLRIYKAIEWLPIVTTYTLQCSVLKKADALIVESSLEADYISKHYGIPSTKVSIIPNGVDAFDYQGNEIYEISNNLKNPYVIQVGRFNHNKNQLNVIRALKDTSIHLVLVGGPNQSDSYYDLCLNEAKGCDNIHFLGWQSQDSPLFMSALHNADTLVMASFEETFGLVALEGVMAGTKLALSNNLPILSYKALSGVKTFDPSTPASIRKALLEVVGMPKTADLKIKFEDTFSWDNVIQKHLDIYESIK